MKSNSSRAAILAATALLILRGFAAAADASWRERLAQAERLYKDGKSRESVEAAQAALADAEKRFGSDAPEVGHILARLSRFYQSAGDSDRYPEMETRLSAVTAKDCEVWTALGWVLRMEEKSSAAQSALKKALALKPDDPEAGSELAQLDDQMGRFDEEVSLLKKRISRKPEYYTYFLLGRAYTSLGRRADAKETYAEAKRLGGKTMADAYIEEGYFYQQSGDRVRAREDFEGAIAIDTASPFGYHHMGTFLARGRDYPGAEKNLRKALEILEASPEAKPDDFLHTFTWLGGVLASEGRPAEAESIFRRCFEKPSPGILYVACLQSLGDLYSSQAKYAQAEETLKRISAVCEEGAACTCRGRALAGLGNFYLGRGRKREASAMADQADRLCVGFHPTWDLSVLIELAKLCLGLGDRLRAETFFARALAERGSRTFGYNLPAMAEMAVTLGRLADAEDIYRQGVRMFDSGADAEQEAAMLDGLAAACEKEGRLPEAAAARTQAIALRARAPK